MARKSRKENAAAVATATEKSGYRTAIYVRLSREDERKIESDTVENQIEFLQDFVEKDDSLILSGLYVDRHFTGTKFDRPEFNRMIADVKSGSINCVVVKDLSRLGRNYLEAGDYIEKIFPFFGVRFIAVTDNYDSLTSSASEDGLVVPLKNLINEAYAKDVSKKICTTFENMFKQGIFLATTAAYGYRKDPDDPHNVLVDEDVCDVVVRIFKDYTGGKSLAQIARELNAEGVLAPSVYWQEKDVIHIDKFHNLWEGKQVRRILENPIYTGDVQIAKTQKCYYKGITSVTRRENGYYVAGHHEAIVDHDIYDRAQERLQKKRREYQAARGKYDGIQNQKEDMLQGVLVCGHCGNLMNMYRKTIKLVNGVGHYSTYVCRRSATYGDVDPAKNVKAEKLETMVLELIKAHIAVYVDAKDRLRMLNRTEKSVGERAELEKEFAGLEERRTKVCDFIRNLYEDFADGILTEEEYLEMKAGYVSEQEKLDADMEKRKSQMDTFDDGYGGEKQMADAFAKYLGADALSRDMVQTFIKKITCYSKDRFEVEYNFADELAALIELADKRGVDVA
jgi:DNA invertase Pin-like site-specific DNA recombinase